MCGSIKALYNVINIFLETKFLILYNSPTFLLSILHTLSICFFHVKFLSIHIPRKDVDSTDSRIVLPTSTWPDTLNVLRLFLNNIYLVLLTLMVSLFELHHETTACRFRLTSAKSILPSLILKVWNKLESSANNLKLKYFDELGKSFMYKRNKVGPNTDPCGTPHVIDLCVDFISS